MKRQEAKMNADVSKQSQQMVRFIWQEAEEKANEISASAEESLLRLKEPAVLLHCREDDLELVESVLHSAKNDYAEKANVHPSVVVVDNYIFLPSAPNYQHAHGPFCFSR